MKKFSWLFLITLLVLPLAATSQTTYYSIASGNWNANSTWSIIGPGGAASATAPSSATDIINIVGGFTVTITGTGASCASITIADNSTLNVNNGLTVNGTTTIGGGTSGSLSINTTAGGTRNFNGLVTLNAGATWTESASGSPTVSFSGGISNNGGTFTAASATHSFFTTQTLNGSLTIPRISISTPGIQVTNNGNLISSFLLTVSGTGTSLVNNGGITASTVAISTVSAKVYNNGSLSISTALTGAGTVSFPEIVQGSGSVLTLNGTTPPAAGALPVTVNGSSTANSVYYGASAASAPPSGDQTVLNGSYNNLILQGSGIKSFQAATIPISGNFNVGGTATVSSTGTTLQFSGDNQLVSSPVNLSFSNIQLNGAGTKIFNANLSITSALSVSLGSILALSNVYAYTGNSISLAGGAQGAGTYGSSLSGATNKTDVCFSGNGLIDIATGSFTYYAITSGSFTTKSTWSTLGFLYTENFGTFPGSSDAVYLGNGTSVSVTGLQSCASLSFVISNLGSSTLSIANASTLNVSGSVTIPRPNLAAGSNIIDVGSGSLSIGSSLDFINGASGLGLHQVTATTGAITVLGNVTGSGVSSTIAFSGAGNLSLGNALFTSANGTLNTFSGSTVSYTGSVAQVVQFHSSGYHHLILSGTGTKTIGGGLSVGGNLSVLDNAILSVGSQAMAVNGTTSIGTGTGGQIIFTSTGGSKDFLGLVTVASGAIWNNQANRNFNFYSGFSGLGTINGGTAGNYNFGTNNASLTGNMTLPNIVVSNGITLSIPGVVQILNNLTITGVGTTVANNGTLIVGTSGGSVSGAGKIVQGPGASLSIANTTSLSGGITATGLDNTVTYNGGNQTIISGNYYHLNLGGSGLKTLLTGTTAINGNLSITGTAMATAVVGIAISGSVNISASAGLTPNSYSHSVKGNWVCDGTMIGTGSSFTFNGGNQSIANATTATFSELILAGTGIKIFASSLEITANMTINTGVMVDLGSFTTHTAGTLTTGSTSKLVGTHGSDTPDPDPDYVDNVFFAPSDGYLTTAALVFYPRLDGAWNSPTTWSNITYNGIPSSQTPGPENVVRMGGNRTVTITANASCTTLSFLQAGTELNVLNINTGVTLTVSGNVTIPRTTNSVFNSYNRLNVGGGNLNVGNIIFANGGTSTSGFGVRHSVDVSTGTIIVNGNIIGSGATSTINMTGNGTLKLFGTLFPSGSASGRVVMAVTSNVEYAGVSQIISDRTYGGNLILSGSGTQQWSLFSARTISGSLIINSGNSLTIVNNQYFTIDGQTIVYGALNFSSNLTNNPPIRTFQGDVTIHPNATWVESTPALFTFGGSFIFNGSLHQSGSGVHTFTGSGKTIGGTLTTLAIPKLFVDGSYTTAGILTIAEKLKGSGLLSVGSGATLNLGDSVTVASLDASVPGNTVNYYGAKAQPLVIPVGGQYQNLSFNNTTANGIATLPVNGVTLSIGGSLINNGAVAVSGNYGFDPNNATFVFNGSGAQVIGGASPCNFPNLTINSSGTVDLQSNATVTGTLHLLKGNFTNSAALTLGNDAVINRNTASTFAGAGPITGAPPLGNRYHLIYSGTGSMNTGSETLGAHVKDVTIGLSGMLTQATTLNLFGKLTVNAGATYDPGNNLLTVKSWADTGTDAGGSIGSIAGIFVANPVIVERYSRPKNQKDIFFSSPVSNASVAQLQTAFPVTGSFVGTSYPCTGCKNNGSSLRWYKESVPGVINKGYQGYPSNSNTETLAPGIGYDAWMWNNTDPTTISFSGPINQGNINGLGTNVATGQVVTKTMTGSSADGWNLIGNPYPAPIRWSGNSINGWSLTYIHSQAWAWDVYNGLWVAIDPGSDIAIGQAFWVQVITPGAGTGTINITEAAKSSARPGAYYREKEDEARLTLKLSNGSATETAFIVQRDSASSLYSYKYDFSKMELGIETMHMTLVKDGYNLGFYGYNHEMENDIPIRVVAEAEGTYELSFEVGGRGIDFSEYQLLDVVTGDRLPFMPDLKYSFHYNKQQPEKRFVLTRNTDDQNNGLTSISVFPNPTTDKFTIMNSTIDDVRSIEVLSSSGEIVYQYNELTLKKFSGVEFSLRDQPSGVYLVKINLGSKVLVKRVVKN